MIIMRTIKHFRFQLIRQVIPGDGPINRFIFNFFEISIITDHREDTESSWSHGPMGDKVARRRDQVTRNNLCIVEFEESYQNKT